MRWAICLSLAFAGCVATVPSDHTITADIACEAARALIVLRQEIPPTPPQPSDGKCKVCNGTGKMPTDGRIVIQCNACGGTGRETKSVLACPDGKCGK